MIDRIIAFSIHRRWLVIAMGMVLALAGVYSVYHTPMDAIPNLSENQVIVFTDWMGHSPREIEDQVTYPLSVALEGLAGVRVVRSSSDFNFSMIHVILEDSVDYYFARQQVSERLARAAESLPAGVSPYLAADGVATGQIFWYTVESDSHDLGELRAIQDWYVGRQIQSVPGVAEVASVGGYPIEYQVALDPHRLKEHGLTPGGVVRAVAESNAAVGGHVVEKGNAEYIVRGVGWLGAVTGKPGEDFDRGQAIRDLEDVLLEGPAGEEAVRLADVARIALASGPRRGALEKDGNEVTGGVVLMRYGHNPLEVTRRIKQKIEELRAGLPEGVRIVPVYDRTALIEGAVATVSGTVLEAMITASVCVLLVLLHVRTSLVIAITLPLAALASFVIMALLRWMGIADIQTNIMSLAGIAISIGVLVDSSIVMAENVLHTLHQHYPDRPVRGDTRPLVLRACRTVGRPIFFSVLIMLISFLPVFALGGMEGKMFRPLAFTKSFAMLSVAVLAITLVPALCTVLIRGRVRHERDSWLVRSMIDVYRPVLWWLLDRPAALAWILSVTFVVGFAPLGWQSMWLVTLLAGLLAVGWLAESNLGRTMAMASLVLVALAASTMEPLQREFVTPLDEGMVMDMPITVPRASITQSVDDLKARDMVLCRFPEVAMVVGKAGRAETPTDPAPLDMIETMVEFRPREQWPKRKLEADDARQQVRAALDLLVEAELIHPPADADREALIDEAMEAMMPRYDGVMREYAYQRNRELARRLGPELARQVVRHTAELLFDQGKLKRRLNKVELAIVARDIATELPARLAQGATQADSNDVVRHAGRELARLGWVDGSADLFDYRPSPAETATAVVRQWLGRPRRTFFSRVYEEVLGEQDQAWREHIKQLNGELAERAAGTCARMAIEELLSRSELREPRLAEYLGKLAKERSLTARPQQGAGHHHGPPEPPDVPPEPALKKLQERLADRFRGRVLLWACTAQQLSGHSGELDQALQMPGWTNVWTMPIQNRVDMLATGVNTEVGIRVLGRNLEQVVATSERIAEVVEKVPGASGVVADPIRGKGYLEIRVDRRKAARMGLSLHTINETIEVALAGRVATWTVEARQRHPVRVRYGRQWREDEQSVRNLPLAVRSRGAEAGVEDVRLSDVADVRIVEGPATIKSENGLLRNYVRLNASGRDATSLVEEARRTVARQVRLPAGVHIEWTGQFEHEARARRTLMLAWPAVIVSILVILYITYRDAADAALMVLPVLGALAGGVLFQWLLGYNLSVNVWVGYIACFGMAASTGIVMLVYLREAVANAGGLERLSLPGLRQAVMQGAVQRLRPKLLTEATTIIGLAPMLWASGPGAEVIKPMAAPVLGGILVADEVIDLLLPVLFYWVRRRRWRRLHAAELGGSALVEPPPASIEQFAMEME